MEQLNMVWIIVVVAIATVACDDERPPDGGDADVDAAADADIDDAGSDGDLTDADAATDAEADDPPSLVIDWEACPMILDAADDPTLPDAECAHVELPLDHARPDGERITIFVKRLRGSASASRRQLWLLHGGMSSGEDFAAVLYRMHLWDDRYDLYVLDHRGTGRSARLGCPDAEAETSDRGRTITRDEWPSCLAEVEEARGPELPFITTTQAARDLDVLIEATREPDTPVYLYGASYGTYWLQRYLQLQPDGVDGVILDSVTTHEVLFNESDFAYQTVGQAFMDHCAASTTCTEHLGDDPWGATGDMLESVEGGHCSDLTEIFEPYGRTSRRGLVAVMTRLLLAEATRALVPAVVHRAARCSPADVAALETLAAALLSPSTRPSAALFSWPAFYHVYLSERWAAENPDCDALADEVDDLAFSSGAPVALCRMYDDWPRYDRDEHVGVWPESATPALLLYGDLDPQTSAESAAGIEAAFDGEHQHHVHFPTSPHGLLSQTPVVGQPLTCGETLLYAFFDDLRGELDRSCVDAVRPIRFTGHEDASAALLGTSDMWGDP